MAKRRYVRSRKLTKPQVVKRWFYTITWFAVVMLILFFIGRLILSENTVACDIPAAPGGEYEKVIIPEGMENETHEYRGFVVYFNKKTHIANCVSYELTREESEGTHPRYKNFETDPNLSGSANPWDYTNSGFDRGHLAPAGDMKWDEKAMHETFYMSNIAPQVHSLNAGAWKSLEDKVRDWAARDGTIVVVTGPVLGKKYRTIGATKVAVPEGFFKVVLAPTAKPIRAIGFLYSNAKSKGAVEKHCVTVDSVERLTGLDFFSALPDETEKKVEAECNPRAWEVRQF